MTVSDYIALELERRGIQSVFELSGGMITYLIDSLANKTKIAIVSMHHEQGAAFAAEGAARITGLPGIAMATSGPGAINLLTGIGSCHFDSTPAVFITGQVNRNEQKGDRGVRQLGFQETDIVQMARPITKAAFKVSDPDEVPALLDECFRIAMEGRRGPVILDVPMDVQRTELSSAKLPDSSDRLTSDPDESPASEIERLLETLDQCHRPLILAGGGIRSSCTARQFQSFVELLNVPVVHSLMAVDVLPYDHPLRVGMLGSYGNRWANIAVANSDFILVIGSRLDVRQTGSQTRAFAEGKAIFHVDCDASEMNGRVTGCRELRMTLPRFFDAALKFLPKQRALLNDWTASIADNKARWPDTSELEGVPGINPNVLMKTISERLTGLAGYVVDVGQHQMWAAQSLRLLPTQRFLTSGGMGSMGFALPAAVGACIGSGRKTFCVIAGDGGLQCNIQELETIHRGNLPIKIVVANNQCHGMVRQFQESYLGGRYNSTLWGYSAPDFRRVAEAYGIPSRRIHLTSELGEALEWLEGNSSALLEVMVDTMTNVYPKLAFGRPISEMEPLSKPTEVEST